MSGAVQVSFAHAHPAPDGLEPGRGDMGLDCTFRKVWCSMVDAVVEYAGEFAGWDGSKGIITRATESLDHHPNLKRWCPSGWFYVVEGIEPVVSNGQHVRAGEVIGHAARNPYNGIIGNIEHGVSAQGRPGEHVQVDALAKVMGEGSDARRMVFNYEWGCVHIIGMSPATTMVDAGHA
jgi:hypothetical protein